MSSLSEELAKTIEANLPAEVSKRLQDRLALLDNLEPETEELRAKVTTLEGQVAKAGYLEGREGLLDEREERLAAAERAIAQERQVTEVRTKSLEDRRQDTWRMLELLLQNRVIRTNIQRDIPLASSGFGEGAPGGENLAQAQETTEREEG